MVTVLLTIYIEVVRKYLSVLSEKQFDEMNICAVLGNSTLKSLLVLSSLQSSVISFSHTIEPSRLTTIAFARSSFCAPAL
jgi:hypothetical protein